MPSVQRCPQCDYVLTGRPDEHRCPECGMPFDLSMVVIKESLDFVFLVIFAGAFWVGVLGLGILAGNPVWSGVFGAVSAPALLYGGWRFKRRRRNRAVISKSGIRLISWNGKFDRSFRWDQIATVEHTDVGPTEIRSPTGKTVCAVPLRYFGDHRQARRFAEECTRRLAGNIDRTPP
jgi:hypothetical protein